MLNRNQLLDIVEDSYVFQEQLSGRSLREIREMLDDENPRTEAKVRAFDDADINGTLTISKLRSAAAKVAKSNGYKSGPAMLEDGFIDYSIGSAIVEIAAFGEIVYA